LLLPVTYTEAQTHTHTHTHTHIYTYLHARRPNPSLYQTENLKTTLRQSETNLSLTESFHVIVRPPDLLFGMR
jgi:hypothetical protein